MKYYKVVDFIQWVWKYSYNIDHSKSKIKKDLEQGAIRLNDQKLTVDTIIQIDDGV